MSPGGWAYCYLIGFSKQKNIICSAIYKHKHSGKKIRGFNNEYLTPLSAKILQEDEACLFMGNVNVNLLYMDKNPTFWNSTKFCPRIFSLLTFYGQQGWPNSHL